MEVDVDTRCTILNYLKLIKKRASGKILLKGDVQVQGGRGHSFPDLSTSNRRTDDHGQVDAGVRRQASAV